VTSKDELRAEMRRVRRRLAAEAPSAATDAATRLPLERLPAFASFAAYMAQGAEFDPAPLMRKLAGTGAVAALPRAESQDAPMVFRAWDLVSPLVPDIYGVPSPRAQAAVVPPDLVIAPLLAFDRRGGRLGQGAGHYDRALADLRRTKPVFVLGLAYAGQELPEVPMQAHDERLDAILTETEFVAVVRED
jgi:5-formyltetrahydrofolate cyclo-ligase